MKPSQFAKSMKDYLREIYLEKPPEMPEGIHADLHVHPYIHDRESLEHTLEVMDRNGLDLLAITKHGKKNRSIEYDFWDVKDLIKEEGLADRLEMEDKGNLFSLGYNGKRFNFISGYEMYVRLPGVKGGADIISLMPNRGFERIIEEGLSFQHFQGMNRSYEALMIAAHPFTIHDPYGPFKAFRFRLATEDERGNIQENLFPNVDAVDLVATNDLWMYRSDQLVKDHYPKKPLTNSDVHGKCRFARKKMGISRNVFHKLDFSNDSNLKESLFKEIVSEGFDNYLLHLRPEQFFVSVCLGNIPARFFP